MTSKTLAKLYSGCQVAVPVCSLGSHLRPFRRFSLLSKSSNCVSWREASALSCRPIPVRFYLSHPARAASFCLSSVFSLIFERKMESHAKKCLSAKRQKLDSRPPWIVEDLNTGSDDEAEKLPTRPTEHSSNPEPELQPLEPQTFVPLLSRPSRNSVNKVSKLSTLPAHQLVSLVEKVSAAFEKVAKHLELRQLVDLTSVPHFELKPNTSDPHALTPTGAFSSKHAPQHDSIIAHLRHLNALNSDCLFVEYGAGRGTLSWIISEASGGSDHILIDRGHFRRKAETRVRSAALNSATRAPHLFVRVHADIKDFDMTKMPQLVSTAGKKQHVAVSKHLCGAATDLTLRCIHNAKKAEPTMNVCPDVVMIALCCHQKCSWQSFCDKRAFLDMGFSSDDFDFVRAMSCWAVCKIVDTQTVGTSPADDSSEDDSAPPAEFESSSTAKQTFSAEEREAIGRKCKRLLDYCRLQYMNSMGYETFLVRYCNAEVTPENVALIGLKQKDAVEKL